MWFMIKILLTVAHFSYIRQENCLSELSVRCDELAHLARMTTSSPVIHRRESAKRDWMNFFFLRELHEHRGEALGFWLAFTLTSHDIIIFVHTQSASSNTLGRHDEHERRHKEKTNDDDYHFRDAVMINKTRTQPKRRKKNETKLTRVRSLSEKFSTAKKKMYSIHSRRGTIKTRLGQNQNLNCYFLVLDEFRGSSTVLLFYTTSLSLVAARRRGPISALNVSFTMLITRRIARSTP